MPDIANRHARSSDFWGPARSLQQVVMQRSTERDVTMIERPQTLSMMSPRVGLVRPPHKNKPASDIPWSLRGFPRRACELVRSNVKLTVAKRVALVVVCGGAKPSPAPNSSRMPNSSHIIIGPSSSPHFDLSSALWR
jgi:hypothetical protein